MKNPDTISRGAVAFCIVTAFLPCRSVADQTIADNLTVTGAATIAADAAVGGNLDVEGNNFTLGNNAGNYGVGMFYLPSGTDGTRWRLMRLSAWLWEVDNGGTVTPAMRLDASNNLTLYSGGTAALTLNPAARSLSLGDATLTANGTGLATNGAVTVGGALTAPNYTASGGAMTGGASGLALNAGGTDQNLTLNPSGNGNVIVNGNLGVGTATPGAKVDVAGNVRISSTSNALLGVGAVGTADNGSFEFFASPIDVAATVSSSIFAQSVLRTHSNASEATKPRVSGIFINNEVTSAGTRDGIAVDVATPASYSSPAGSMRGIFSSATHTGSGAVGVVVGQFSIGETSPGSGAATQVWGSRSAAINGSVATNVTGVLVNAINHGTASVVKGVTVVAIPNSGTITDTYGVYVGDITSGTQTNKPFSFYASDPNADNYFAGKVGIGTSVPGATLDVAGTASIGGNLRLAAGTPTQAPLSLQSGALLSTPSFGAVEFDGAKLYITNNAATPTRNALAYEATTLAGYGITDPVVLTTGSYANPAWITSLGAGKLTGTLPAGALPAFAGDVTSNAGSSTLTLANSGVTAGTYPKVTVDAKGRVTAGASLTSGDVTGALGYTPVNKAGDTLTGPLTATTLTASSGSVTGGVSGLTLNAGGSDQNIALAPSGAGRVTTGAPVALSNATASTSSTTGALTVAGGAGIAGDVNVGGTLATGGLTNYPLRIHTVNLAAQSSAQFYPVTLSGLPQGKVYRFSIELPSQSSSSPFNQHSLSGVVRGGGWSDYPSFFDVVHTFYDANERSVLGLYRGTQGWTDVALYVRGGAIYYVSTDAPTVTAYTTPQTLGDTTLAIKDSTGVDINGASVAIVRVFDSYSATSGRFTDRALATAATTASTSPTTGALTVAGGVGIGGNLNVGGTFSASNYTASGGTVTGGSMGLSLNAGGSNQNIVLTPSGTGAVRTNLGDVAALSTNGFAARTGSGSYAARAIVGTAGQINVTNGDGVSGNPTISLPSTITQATAFSANGVALATSSGRIAIGALGVSDTDTFLTFYPQTAGSSIYHLSNSTGVLRFARGSLGSESSIDMTVQASGINVAATTASTSPTTGSATFGGGIGVGGAGYFGGVISGASNVRFGGATSLASSTGVTPVVQVASSSTQGSFMLVSGTSDLTAPAIYSAKMRGGVGVFTTATITDDALLFLAGEGADGVSALRRAGSVGIYSDGNFSATSSPGRIAFNTTPLGSTAATERMRVTSAGNLLLGGTTDVTGSGNLKVFGTADATSITTGALQIAGGGSFQKNLYVGGNMSVAGSLSAANLSSATLSAGAIASTSGLTLAAGGTDQNVTLAPSGTGSVSTAARVEIGNSTASTSTSTGALTISGGVGVAGALNARTVTANTMLGTLPAGLTNNQNLFYATAAGDASGTTDFRPHSIQATALGTNNMSVRALDVGVSTQNSAGNVSMLGLRMLSYVSGAGSGSATAYSASPYVTNNGNMTSWVGYEAANGAFTSTGDVTGTMTAFRNGTFGRATATTVTAFHAQDLTKGSGVAAGFRGQVTAGPGKYNLYMDGPAANLLAGQTTITNTTASTDKDTGALVVEGGVGIEGNLNVGGTFTAANYTANSGTITGGTTTGLNLAAGGTNQNVTVTPTGTGSTILNGKVGIGTGVPSAKLDVTGGNILVSAPAANNQDLFIANAGGRKVEIVTDAEGDGKLMLRDAGGTNTQVAITAGGSSYLNGGSVGIGTTSPLEKLHVSGTVRADVDNRMGFILRENSGDNFRGGLGLKNNGDAYLELWKDDGTVTRLDANGSSYLMGGNLGVGTQTPTAKLDVAGGANFAGNIVTTAISGRRELVIQAQGTATGTTDSPVLALRRNNSAFAQGNIGEIRFDGLSTSGAYAEHAGIWTRTTGPNTTVAAPVEMLFRLNNGTAVQTPLTISPDRLAVAGGVGVNGDVNVNGNLVVTGTLTTANSGSNGVIAGSTNGLALNAGGTGNQNITLTPSGAGSVVLSGSVGVGTATPAQKFEVSGGYARISYSDAPYLDFYHSVAGVDLKTTRIGNRDGALLFESVNDAYTLPTERMRIAPNGNVGIGTSSPAYRLHLADSAKQLSFGMGEPISSIASETGYRVATWNDNNVYVDAKVGSSGSINFRYGEGAQTGSSNTWMVVKNGNVGIGTATPTAKLEVAGELRVTGAGNTVLKGVVLVTQQGDLEMGDFTAGANPNNL